MVPFFKKAFFSQEEARDLCALRVVFCLSTAIVLLAESGFFLGAHLLFPYKPAGLGRFFFGDFPPSDSTYVTLYAALILALIFAAVGVRARIWLLVAIGCYFAFFSFFQAGLAFGRRYNATLYLLIILSMSPGVGALRLDRLLWGRGGSSILIPSWPVSLARLTVMIIFFNAGASKLLADPSWYDGRPLQTILMESAQEGNKAFLLSWMVESEIAPRILSVFTLIIELGFVLSFFMPKLIWLYLPAVLVFHAGCTYYMNVAFFGPLFWCSYLPFFRLSGLEQGLYWLRKRILAIVF